MNGFYLIFTKNKVEQLGSDAFMRCVRCVRCGSRRYLESTIRRKMVERINYFKSGQVKRDYDGANFYHGKNLLKSFSI